MKKFRIIYIAGPYRAEHPYQIEENIERAKQAALAVWHKDHVALCPHMNSARFEGVTHPSNFIEGTLELMRRCDAVLVLAGWLESEGTMGEIKEAERLRIPVFYNRNELFIWLEEQDNVVFKREEED